MISVRELRTQGSKIWKNLKRGEDFLLTSHGKPIGVIYPILNKDIEKNITLFKKARAIQAAETLRKVALKKGYDKMSQEEINEWVNEARKKK